MTHPTALTVKVHPDYATTAQLAQEHGLKVAKTKSVVKWANMPNRVFDDWERYQFRFYHRERFGRELKLYNEAMEAKRVKTSAIGRQRRNKGQRASKWALEFGYEPKQMYKIFRYLRPCKAQVEAAIARYEEVHKPKYAFCRYCEWSEVETKRGGRFKQFDIHLETCPSKPGAEA